MARQPLRSQWAVLAAIVMVGACAFDWDGYDPRLAPTKACTPGESRSCYEGPDGTADIGLCLSGTQTCGADEVYGPCEGQVLPSDEQCDTLADEDCDGTNLDGDAGCVCEAGQFGACYEGPAGTEGVGQCVAGQGQCDASGTMTIGNCVAQVLPFNEECASLADDDCDGVANDHCGTWSKRLGDVAVQTVRDMALDANGGVVICGQMAGVVDFGGGPLDGLNTPDIFMAKLEAATGAHQWSRILASNGSEIMAQAAAFDPSGDVIVAGYIAASVDFGPPVGTVTSLGGKDAFVAKLDGATGATVWVYVAGGLSDAEVTDVAVDGAGNVTAVGMFAGTIDFGNGAETANGTDGFIVQLDATGAPSWQVAGGGAGVDVVHAVAVTAAGDIAAAGEFAASIDVGGGTWTAAGTSDGFVVALDATGASVWSKQLSGSGAVAATEVALDAMGNVRVAGSFDADVDLGGGSVTSAGGSDAFVVALDAAGNHQWQAVYGDDEDQSSTSIAVGSGGEVILGLSLSGSALVGGMPVYSVGDRDWLVIVHDTSGMASFARRFGDEFDDDLHKAVMASDGSILVAGDTLNHFNLGDGDTVGSANITDMVVGRLSP